MVLALVLSLAIQSPRAQLSSCACDFLSLELGKFLSRDSSIWA